MTTLEVKDLHVSVVSDEDGTDIPILKGVNLTVKSGETHAVMGPNGSGKSTLSYAIAGHPKYTVTSGSITLDGEDVLAMSIDERARAGLFLAMQYPIEVPGVSMSNFLRTAATAVRGEAPKLRHWVKEVKAAMTDLDIDPAFSERSVNEGFSGGEKKRHEILQLGLLKPKIAILDETDSGLDVDALRVVSEGVNRYAEDEHGGVLLITHYTRILRYIQPQFVHVFVDGRIIESGGPELADELEENGYERFTQAHRPRQKEPDMTTSVDRALDLEGIARHPGRLPDPGPGDARRMSAGVPGFRCDFAAPRAGSRRGTRLPRSRRTGRCTAARIS